MSRSVRQSLVVFLALLVGCAPTRPPIEVRGEQAASAPVPQDAASCTRAGGRMTPGGRMRTLQCILTYADAGKSCTSGDQCAGDCRAPTQAEATPGQQATGLCQATSDRFGCVTKIENGRVESTICVD